MLVKPQDVLFFKGSLTRVMDHMLQWACLVMGLKHVIGDPDQRTPGQATAQPSLGFTFGRTNTQRHC